MASNLLKASDVLRPSNATCTKVVAAWNSNTSKEARYSIAEQPR
jgi:hypothetical protein